MPFVKIFPPAGKRIVRAQRLELRRKLVEVVVREMECKASWVRPILVKDHFPAVVIPEDGASTILVELGTALFEDRDDGDPQVESTIKAIANVVFEAFRSEYEVEIRVDSWKRAWKYLIEP